MEAFIEINRRVMARHPEISPEDVAHAWAARIATANRRGKYSEETVAVGFDGKGRMLEMVAVTKADGTMHVFHAMTPPSAKTLRETHLVEGSGPWNTH